MTPPGGLSATCDHCGLPLPRALWPSAEPAGAPGPQYCCVGCRIAAAIQAERSGTGAPQTMQLRLVLGLFFSMSVMVFTFALWSYDVYGVDAAHPAAATFVSVLRYLALLFALPVLVLLGGPIVDSALHHLRNGIPTSDLLLMTGVLAAFVYSLVSVARNAGDVYFETACMILVFVTLGRWFEAAGRHHATAALDRLERLIPQTVHALRRGAAVDVPIEEVQPGDDLEVRPGERVPTDGVIVAGATSVDEQLFTGESWPQVKGLDDAVLGGTLNIDGCMRMRITAGPRAGTLQRLVAALQEARLRKGAHQRLADRISQWFLPVIAMIATASFAFRALNGDVGGGLLSALAVVLIACPCALGIATPLAVWVALGRAAEQSVLFRSGDAVERLADLQAVCFDKTGTLTNGAIAVSRIGSESTARRDEMLARASALAGCTNHPLGRAIRGVAESVAETTPLEKTVTVVAGRGVSGVWRGEQQPTRLGSYRFLVTETGWTIPTALRPMIFESLSDGQPLTLIGWDGVVRGVFVFREELRAEATAAIAALHEAGVASRVLTGDHAGRGQALERLLQIPVEAELLPEGKVAAVARMIESHGPTAMVGDGVNDAAAMSAANVGIAMGCGADLTRDHADVCLLSNDLDRLPWALGLARATVGTVRRNIAWAFGYNAVGVVLAAAGWLHPSVAALLMVLSSLAVTANSLRLRQWDANPKSESRNPKDSPVSDFEIRVSDLSAEAVR
ncbi:MAG: heavy metal translocating P-type ATPase [Planctomycetaceae bacterium]